MRLAVARLVCRWAHGIAAWHRNALEKAKDQTEAMAHTSAAADALDDPIMMAWANIGMWVQDLRFRFHGRCALFWIGVTRRMLDYRERRQ